VGEATGEKLNSYGEVKDVEAAELGAQNPVQHQIFSPGEG
jgi:hypothetical protein